MFELIYVSHAQPDIDVVDIDNILKTSQAFNSENDITGCLLFYNHEFVQLLEGGENVVRELYSRIENDKRHFDVKLLSMSYKNSRIFSQWSMAFQNFKDEDWSSICLENNMKNILSCAQLASNPSVAGGIFRSTVQRYLSV